MPMQRLRLHVPCYNIIVPEEYDVHILLCIQLKVFLRGKLYEP